MFSARLPHEGERSNAADTQTHKHKHAAVTDNQGMEYTEDSDDALHAAQKL